MLNVTGLGQFQNYFTGPYLAGTYAFQSFDPLMANPFLNPFLLGQDLAAGQARTGPLDQALGRALFGVNNVNARELRAGGNGAGNGAAGAGTATGMDLIDQIIDRLLERTGGGSDAKATEKADAKKAEEKKAEEKPTAGNSGGSELEALLEQLQGSRRNQPPANPLMNILSGNPFFPGLSGGLNGGGFAGLGGFGGFNLFGNAPIQNPTAPSLATLDPVIRNSILTETMSPINGLFLSSGMIPPSLINGLFANA